MARRTQRPAAAKHPADPAPQPSFPMERHSGEGSASALETLQKLEKRRVDAKPGEPEAR